MKKIIIIGPSGSGKSTLANKLKDILNIPLFHLDNIWWKEDKTHITREDFDSKLQDLLSKNEWIIDGDYSRTYDTRMQCADTIIFLNIPTEICINSVEKRIGHKRSDIPWIEKEFDPEFKEWINNWYKDKLPTLLPLLEKYSAQKDVVILRTREEVNDFLSSIEGGVH